jgi:tape measure domain-containing protein
MSSQTIKISFDLSDLNRVKSTLGGLTGKAVLTVDDSKLKSSINGISLLMTGIAAGISASITSSITSGIGNAMKAGGELITSGIGLAFNKQAQITSLTASLQGNKKQAEDIYKIVQKIADTSPLKTSEILGVTKQLISTGYEVEKSFTVVKALMDAAAVANPTNMGQGLKDLGDVYAKNAAGGRWMTEDLNQFQSRGINITKQLATDLGTTIAGVRKLASEGKLTSDVVEKSFLKMVAAGGQLNGQMVALAGTSVGLKSTMEDAFDAILTQGGEALQPALDASMQLLTTLATDLKEAGVFDEINQQAKEFADWLKANPEYVRQLSNTVKELVKGGMTELSNITKNVIEWLRDPQNMTNLIEGSKAFLENMKLVMQTLAEIIKGIAGLMQAANKTSIDTNSNYIQQETAKKARGDDSSTYAYALTDIIEGKGAHVAVINRQKANYGNYGTNVEDQLAAPGQFAALFKDKTGLDMSQLKEELKSVKGIFFVASKLGISIQDIEKQINEMASYAKEAENVIGDRTSFRTSGTVSGNIVDYGGNSYLNEERISSVVANIANPFTNIGVKAASAGIANTGTTNTAGKVELVSPSSLLNIDSALMTSPMGMRNGRMHSGTDYDFGDGSSIATGGLDGVVSEVGYDEGGYGNYVVVKYPNGDEILYAHLSSVKVKQGDKVGPNTIVGTQGSTGRSSASHLHIEKLVGGKAVEIAGEIDKYLSVKPTYPDLLGKGNKVATSSGTIGGALSSLSGGTLNETKDLFDNVLPELKAKWDKEDADKKLFRANRDAALNIEDAELKALIEKINKVNDSKEDIAIQEARGIELLNKDTASKPLNKKANDDKIKAIQTESKAAIVALETELKDITKANELTQKKRAEEEKLKATQLAAQASQLGLQALIDRETDVNKRDKAAYDLLLNNISDRYNSQLKTVAESIKQTDKLIAEYTKLGVSTTNLMAIKEQQEAQQTYIRSSMGAELDIARSGRRAGGLDFIKGLQSDARATMPQTRESGIEDANTKASNSMAQLSGLRDVLDPEQFKKAAEYINQIKNADISSVKNQFQDLGQIVTTELVVGLGDAFKSVIQGTKSIGDALLDMLGNIASKLLDMAMNSLITDLLGSLFGGNSNNSGGGSSIISAGIGALTGGVGGIFGFATGAVVNKPTLAMIGEGSDSEAVLPIPKLNQMMEINRSIGAASASGGINSNVYVTVNNDGSSTVSGNSASGLANKITEVVKAVIVAEKRPNGLLSS